MMRMTASNKSPKLAQVWKIVTIMITTLLLLPSLVSSLNLFPTVNVTFENQMAHAVDLLCNFEAEHRVTSLMPGEMVWWTLDQDAWFPTVWCYLQVSDDFFGLFWGYTDSMNCGSHCEWRIRDDGLYYVPKEGKWQYKWLNSGNGGFV